MSQKDAQTIWTEAVEKVKDRTINPSLWRALEKARGVLIEEGFFVVGLTPADFPMRGHLTSSEYANTIEICVSEIAGEKLRVRVIEGTTPADYETAKRRDAAAQAARDAAAKRRYDETSASRTWDSTMEQLSRKYANTPMRQLPQMRARYLAEALAIIVEAMDSLYPVDSKADELTERAFARVLERVASLVEMPAADIADRVFRARGELK